MRRNVSIFLAAAVLAVAGTRDARAQAITYTNSNAAFGSANSLTGFANNFSVSNFDVGGGVLLTSNGVLINGVGLVASGTISATFSNLGGGSGVTAIGFTWAPQSNNGILASATFSNGGSYTTATATTAGTFTGFTSTTPFTSVTLNFNSFNTTVMSDFRFGAVTAVPEPSTLLSGGIVVLAACGATYLKRAKRTDQSPPSDDRPAAV